MALPLLGLTDPIDLVVAGINPTANISHDVTYSGTVTAAMEAVISGVQGIAVSVDSPEGFQGNLDYSTAARVARLVAEQVIADDLPAGVVLNVNVPYRKESELKGYMITRQGLRVYHRPARASVLLDRRRVPHRYRGRRHRLRCAVRGVCVDHTFTAGPDKLQSNGSVEEVEILTPGI